MRAIAALFLAAPLIATGQFHPNVPKAWDDAALQSMTMPQPGRKTPVKYPAANWYYHLPERQIFRGYPVYSPKREPENYMNFLEAQEPELAFEESKLTTEGDWNRAGEAVFSAPTGFNILTIDDIHDPAIWEQFQFKVDFEGALPGWRYVIRKKGTVELALTLCGGCHERIIDNRTVAGAPGVSLIPSLTSFGEHRTLRAAKNFDAAASDWINRQFELFTVPWLDPDPAAALRKLTIAQILTLYDKQPPGVAPRPGTSLYCAPKIPDLIGVKDRKYLGATGLYRNSGIEDLMRYAILETGLDDHTTERLSDAQVYALVMYINSFRPAQNENKLDKFAKSGLKIFEREGCPACHPAPRYTNDKFVPVETIGTDPRLTMETRKATGAYLVPSLKNVWYREPLQHSGAAPTLESWFDPIRERGGGEIPPVKGHPYGLKLSFEERQALFAFLNTL